VAEAKNKGAAERTAAQIEADITATRDRLAKNLDELAMRVHPATVAAQTRARMMATVEEKAGRAYVAASGVLEQAKGLFVDEKGRPRLERIVPASLVGVGVVLLVVAARKRDSD
jgi:hypothetical protein